MYFLIFLQLGCIDLGYHGYPEFCTEMKNDGYCTDSSVMKLCLKTCGDCGTYQKCKT